MVILKKKCCLNEEEKPCKLRCLFVQPFNKPLKELANPVNSDKVEMPIQPRQKIAKICDDQIYIVISFGKASNF